MKERSLLAEGVVICTCLVLCGCLSDRLSETLPFQEEGTVDNQNRVDTGTFEPRYRVTLAGGCIVQKPEKPSKHDLAALMQCIISLALVLPICDRKGTLLERVGGFTKATVLGEVNPVPVR